MRVVVAGLTVGLALVVVLAFCSHPAAKATEPQRPVDARPPATATGPSARLALLVGIDRYHPDTPRDTCAPLEGCVRDVQLARDLLTGRFGFCPDDVRVLANEEATHEAIVRAFWQHLVQRSTPSSQVVFWFCGHGSRVPDRSGAEVDGFDSSLLAYDSRSAGRDGAYDLVDDELQSLLQALPTEFVTVITDACHSGTVTRSSAGGASRGGGRGRDPLDWRLLAPFWPRRESAPLPQLDDRDHPDRTDYVHFAACLDDQEAKEIATEDGQHGALTWLLCRTLWSATAADTWRTVARTVRREVATVRPSQSPWAEGRVDRIVFGTGERRLGIPAVVQESRVRLDAGLLAGLLPGWECELTDAAGAAVGRVRVDTSETMRSFASWIGAAPALPAGAALWAEPIAASEPMRLCVQVTDGVARTALAESTWLRVTEPGDPRAESTLVRDETGWTWSTDDGLRLWRHDGGPFPVDAFATQAQQEIRYQALYRLASVRGPWPVDAAFARPSDEIVRQSSAQSSRPYHAVEPVGACGEWCAAPPSYEQQERTGAYALCCLEVKPSESGHLVVLALNEWGENGAHRISVIYPGDTSRADNRIRGGEPFPVPVWVGVEPAWPVSRPIRERYVVLQTEKWFDARVFESGEVRSASDMPEVLLDAMQGRCMRGGRVVSGREPWGVCVVDLLVRAQ